MAAAEDREAERTMSCFCVTSQATYWAKSFPPLCCHLDSIGFSRAGKSNAPFKTNCFLLNQLFLSLDSFTPSWTHIARSGRSAYNVRKHAAEHSFPATLNTAERLVWTSSRNLIMSDSQTHIDLQLLNLKKYILQFNLTRKHREFSFSLIR